MVPEAVFPIGVHGRLDAVALADVYSGDMKIGNKRAIGARGLTYLELLVALAIVAVLASAIIPLHRWTEKRRREVYLRMQLESMRNAIDLYYSYSIQGLIQQSDVEQVNYPISLEELVEGVDVGDPTSPESTHVQFLRNIPGDPFTGEAEWGLRSYQDDWDSDSWGRENIYDVYSLSSLRALDGTYYRDW
jgi:general secretion pathway protein G